MKPHAGGRGWGFGLALAAAVLFGASTPASKVLLERFQPFQLAGLLYLGAALGMLPVVARGRGRRGSLHPDRKSLQRLAGAVLLGGIVGPVLLLLGLRQAMAGSVSLLLNLEMVATAVLGTVLFREHLARVGWLGVAMALGAGVLLSFEQGWPGLAASALVAGACLCWGFDNHFTALIEGVSPAWTTFWKGLVAGSVNLAIGALTGAFQTAPASVLLALLVGGVSYGASIALYIAASQQLGATRGQAVFSTAPFAGAALSFLALDEPLRAVHWGAAGLLVAALLLLLRSQHGHSHRHLPVEHIHSHRHDDGHHLHAHPGLSASARHTHWHRHEVLEHDHRHWPDLHHRHDHDAS